MRLLIDMNLSPDWVEVFEMQGWQTLHWSTVGHPRATDSVIMDWARKNGYVDESKSRVRILPFQRVV